ncbi:DUF3987 domain-containing protein [Geitlerinema splendidum]|nr:DUF3987 domain-containing protein [Geitlerinema splendidum]
MKNGNSAIIVTLEWIKNRFLNKLKKMQKVAEEEKFKREQQSFLIALDALHLWHSFSETGSSPYLLQKKVDPFGTRFWKDYLIVPLRDVFGKMWSLQWIGPEGTKRFLVGGRKKGCFHHLGKLEDGQPILITEGYATGSSVYMATQATTVITFDAGNLEPVIEELKKIYPKSPLLIAGDNDCWRDVNVGQEKAKDAAQKHGGSVVFPQFKNTETHPTDFNDLHVLEGLTAVKEQLKQACQPLQWSEPIPFLLVKNDLSPVVTLSPELIPGPYRDWLVDIAERMQCPLDYVAVGAVIVTASIVGAGCSIRPKAMDSWTVIPNLWGGIIGAPSTLKSPALKEILTPLEVLEKEAFEDYEKDLQQYFIECEAYKVTKEVIKKEMAKAARESDSSAMEAAKEKLRNLAKPQEPHCKRYSTNDVTIEKMHELLSKNTRGLLLFRDELMGVLATWDKTGNEIDRGFYLEAWNGYGSRTTDRIGRGTIYTKNLCISILGGTQPSKLLSYFQHTLSGTDNDGLIQRFQLLVYPDESKKWVLVDRMPNEQAQERASALMIKLASLDFCQYGAHRDEKSEIPYFHFDHEAQPLFYGWLTKLEDRLRSSPDELLLIEHLTKYRKLMPSLALLFHLINLASNKSMGGITVDCVERAMAWCDYLESHARRIYRVVPNPVHQGARNLAKRIQEGDLKDHFDIREVYRKQWSFLKTKEEVESACDILLQNGWIRGRSPSDGRKTKDHFLVNPALLREVLLGKADRILSEE